MGKAVVKAASDRFLALKKAEDVEALKGNGVKARVGSHLVTVGNERMAGSDKRINERINDMKKADETGITGQREGTLIGLLAAKYAERKEVRAAIESIREYNLTHIELLTGDNKETAQGLAGRLGIDFQAEVLPEEKIAIVKKYQAEDRIVVMVGDGINDAPALAQADVGIAMGTTGTDVAIETADITLMRDDWNLMPELLRTARRTMKVIKWNFGFTAEIGRASCRERVKISEGTGAV